MANLQADIQRLVDNFVAQITELANRAAYEGLQQALSKKGGRAGALRLGTGRGRGQKRSSDELEKTSDEFLAFVTKNPGLRIEQINKQLGTSTKDLALPIRKLLAEGYLKAKGKKRSTTYFPGKAKN
ncbi:MAG: hypothetical protein JNL83_37905 [Myxococcales bacterium]|nr:hypothetical protein [Myxococcales bacterium]